MISVKVMKICEKNFDYVCSHCPLLDVCSLENDEIPGSTIEEKTKNWEAAMNAAAEHAFNK